MYTVIKNKVYDTSTAKAIAEYHHEGVTETLYRKKTGEYFCHLYDTAASDDDRRAGWHGKEKIAPYDYATARAWAELKLDKETFESLFESSAQCGETILAVRMSQAAADKVRAMQSATGETIGQIMERLITENL
jgi:hypothetical protein